MLGELGRAPSFGPGPGGESAVCASRKGAVWLGGGAAFARFFCFFWMSELNTRKVSLRRLFKVAADGLRTFLKKGS